MLRRWSRIFWKWSTFWKACNKQNTWECWTCTGRKQQRSATDGVTTRSWSGGSRNCCVQDFDAGSWHEMCCGKICSMASANRAEGTCTAVGRTVWGPKVPTLKGTEASLSCVQCFLYLVSSSIRVSIFHSTWLDTFWIDSLFLSVYMYVYTHTYI